MPWGFGERYFKAKDKLTALPTAAKPDGNSPGNDARVSLSYVQQHGLPINSSTRWGNERHQARQVVTHRGIAKDNFSPVQQNHSRSLPELSSRVPKDAPKGPRAHNVPWDRPRQVVDHETRRPLKRPREEGGRHDVPDRARSSVRNQSSPCEYSQTELHTNQRPRMGGGRGDFRQSNPNSLIQRHDSDTVLFTATQSKSSVPGSSDSWRPALQRSNAIPSGSTRSDDRSNGSFDQDSVADVTIREKTYHHKENGTFPPQPVVFISFDSERSFVNPNSGPRPTQEPTPSYKTRCAVKKARCIRKDETAFVSILPPI
jgi:hypothetical protein